METVQKSIENPQLQYCDDAIDVPAVLVEQVPHVRVVAKTPEITQLQITDKVVDVPVESALQVPRVCVVKKTVEDSQFETVENPETQISDVVTDACLTCDVKCKVACETCVKDNMFMVAGEITVAWKIDDLSSVGSTQQQHNQQHSTRQAMQEKPGRKRERERERGKRERKKGVKEEKWRQEENLRKEGMLRWESASRSRRTRPGWTVVTRNKRQKKTVQIFVKLETHGCHTRRKRRRNGTGSAKLSDGRSRSAWMGLGTGGHDGNVDLDGR